MRRSVSILSGILLLISMLGLLFFVGAIYDAEKKHRIDSFFFQIPPRAENRIETPWSPKDIPSDVMRDMIVARFVNEYFYVIPDTENAVMRSNFKNTDNTTTALRILAKFRPSVYQQWAETEGKNIVDLAEKRVLRTVRILPDISESETGHLIVKYELTTWTKPNDVFALPQVTSGELYIAVTKDSVQGLQTSATLKNLEKGVDPVSAFNLYILDVVQN